MAASARGRSLIEEGTDDPHRALAPVRDLRVLAGRRLEALRLRLTDGERSVLVTFEGYSFFVPKGSAGQDVALEGRVKVKPRPPGEAKHLESEGAGNVSAERVGVVAQGVEIRKPPAP
jgi:hypothetical protein